MAREGEEERTKSCPLDRSIDRIFPFERAERRVEQPVCDLVGGHAREFYVPK